MSARVPQVSVVVPIFDKAPFLAACLASISAQTLRDLEIVLVDDASTDGSLAIAAEHARADDRVVLLRQDVNLGPGPARNRGLLLQVGE